MDLGGMSDGEGLTGGGCPWAAEQGLKLQLTSVYWGTLVYDFSIRPKRWNDGENMWLDAKWGGEG
jgi:hypothetical protein